jgi:hypothetical protein
MTQKKESQDHNHKTSEQQLAKDKGEKTEKQKRSADAPTIGRIVQYRLGTRRMDDGKECEVWRPAIVVNADDDLYPDGCHVSMLVFLDGKKDANVTGRSVDQAAQTTSPQLSVTSEECIAGFAWRTSVDQGDSAGTWRWPPRT